MSAVKAEINRIKRRLSRNLWSPVRHYVFLSNAKLSTVLRENIQKRLRPIDKDMRIHIHDGTDLCNMLDSQPTLRRSFPQLLGLQDFESLLSHIVNQDIVKKSHLACENARDLTPVFVPTSAYFRAWSVLRRNHFAVLEGPPEMGKTTIAWIIALNQVVIEWEAVVCDFPQDIFRHLNDQRSQVFIADDAFGRTEYDPSRGRTWERQLERVIRALDPRHWLIWTSRKHILERAIHGLDLQGVSAQFPRPSDVLVDASQLDTHEKALMLYRHTRAGNVDQKSIDIVKESARLIVNHDSFTPERIRQFVQITLPSLVASQGIYNTKAILNA